MCGWFFVNKVLWGRIYLLHAPPPSEVVQLFWVTDIVLDPHVVNLSGNGVPFLVDVLCAKK